MQLFEEGGPQDTSVIDERQDGGQDTGERMQRRDGLLAGGDGGRRMARRQRLSSVWVFFDTVRVAVGEGVGPAASGAAGLDTAADRSRSWALASEWRKVERRIVLVMISLPV